MAKVRITGVVVMLCLSCVLKAQGTQVPWSSLTSSFGVFSDGTNQAQVIAGQSFVGSLQGSNTNVGTGFFSNPLISVPPLQAGILTVTTVDDGGEGSLRWAIESANTTAGVNIIRFDIAGSGVQTIAPVTPLPPFNEPVIIDGFTQQGASKNTSLIGEANNAELRVQLTGPGALSGTTGLVLRGGNSIVRGLIINAFGTGISIDSGSGNTIQGNFIGTDSSGSINRGNQTGVRVLSSGNTIGGTSPAAFNVISANLTSGILIAGAFATGNQVLGNFLGASSSGDVDLTNGCGIWLESSSNFIGGANLSVRNVILGGGNPAIYLPAGNDGGNIIRYNFVGTNASGTAGLGAAGIYILTPDNVVNNNVISGNRGVLLQEAAAGGNIIQGNLVGLSADGTTTLSNNGGGINLLRVSHTLIGGLATEERNVITVLGTGIDITNGDSNTVQGNYIGTDATGTVGLISGGAAGSGISITASTNNLVGGIANGARNVIANSSMGVSLTWGATGNTVQGNFIGTNASGTAAIPNRTRGVSIVTPQGSQTTRDNLIGGTDSEAGNLISGNFGPGMLVVGAQHNTIQGNAIGLAVNGIDPIPNSSDGIQISFADSNLIGGLKPGAGNRIAFNGVGFTDSRASGVKIFNGIANAIFSNSIFANTRLAIDLAGGTEDLLGVTANDSCDADAGPNGLQNYPVLTSALPGTDQVTITGTLNGMTNSTFLLEFFSSPVRDTSGHGGARDVLGSVYVTTDNDCLAPFEVTFPIDVPLGHYITSTATDSVGNTSEFSLSIANGVTSVAQEDELPKTFALGQNYPNPFNPSTTIGFQVSVQSYVTLKLYDVMGREITTLVNEMKPIGKYEVVWNAANLASGIYFYRITAGAFVNVKKLVLLR